MFGVDHVDVRTLSDGRWECLETDRELDVDRLSKGSGGWSGGNEGDKEDCKDAIAEQCGCGHAVVHLCHCYA